MKGIVSRLRTLFPITSLVNLGVTFHCTPSRDCLVVCIISWNLVVVVRRRSLTRLSQRLPVKFNLAPALFAMRLACQILVSPKFLELDSVHVLPTDVPLQSVCHEPQSTSLNPVWTLIPNLLTAASYCSVFSVIFASTLFVSVQVSESGFIFISPE